MTKRGQQSEKTTEGSNAAPAVVSQPAASNEGSTSTNETSTATNETGAGAESQAQASSDFVIDPKIGPLAWRLLTTRGELNDVEYAAQANEINVAALAAPEGTHTAEDLEGARTAVALSIDPSPNSPETNPVAETPANANSDIEAGAAALLVNSDATTTAVIAEPPAPAPAPAVVASASAKVGVASAPVLQPSGAAFSPEAQKLIDEIKASGNTQAINAIESIRSYMVTMKPGKQMQSVEGARHQVNLFRTLQLVINSPSDNFPLVFATILKIMDDNRDGVFGGRYLYRFTENFAMSVDDRKAFERILNLMTSCAAVKGRSESVKHVDFPRSLQYGVNEEGRRRILAFFKK